MAPLVDLLRLINLIHSKNCQNLIYFFYPLLIYVEYIFFTSLPVLIMILKGYEAIFEPYRAKLS